MASFHSEVVEKPQRSVRWVILALLCFTMMGSYYCFDNPAALKTQIGDRMGNPSDYETLFNLLYTVYSIPNIFLPFFGGYFVDKLGGRLCMIIFACFIWAGQVVFAFGLSIKSFPVMLVGRCIFGLGGENLSVGQSAMIAEWFFGKELAFGFGIALSLARLGSVINNLVSPAVASTSGVVAALWIGVIMVSVSVACTIMLFPLDKAAEMDIERQRRGVDSEKRSAAINNPDYDSSQRTSRIMTISKDYSPDSEIHFSDVKKFGVLFWLLTFSCLVVYGCVIPFNNVASSFLLERDYFMTPPNDCQLTNTSECQSSSNPPVSDCPSSDWYQPPLPIDVKIDGKLYDPLKTDDIDCEDNKWSDGCTKEYCNRQTDATLQAGAVMSIPYIISATISPFLGFAVDRIGCRAYLATVAPCVLIVVHSLLGLTDISPIGPLVGQGLAYAVFAAVLWPSVPLVVGLDYVGLAYGLMTAVQNCGLALFPLCVAGIYQENDEYVPNVSMFFVGLACGGAFIGILLNICDKEGMLNRPKYKAEEEEGGDQTKALLYEN